MLGKDASAGRTLQRKLCLYEQGCDSCGYRGGVCFLRIHESKSSFCDRFHLMAVRDITTVRETM